MSKPPKEDILFLCRRFPPSVGGMEKFAAQIVKSLETRTNLRAFTWGGSNRFLPAVLAYLLLGGLLSSLKRRPDVIHAQDAVLAPLAWLIAKMVQRPYSVMTHGLDLTYDKFGYQKLIVPFVRKADRVMAISDATAQQAIERSINPDIIDIIPLAVEPDIPAATASARNELELLTIGRLVERKGVEWFICKVLPELAADFPDITYHVVGTGDKQEDIEAAVASAGMTNNVVLHGLVSEQDKLKLLGSVGIFVMPNIPVPDDMEGFGLVAQEAALCGITVIAADLEGIKTAVVDGRNGYLIEPLNASAFRQKISDCVKSPDREFSTKAIEFTKSHFSLEAMADRICQSLHLAKSERNT